MITPDDILQHLAELEGGEWPTETIAAVLAAERAAQKSVLNVPSPRPVDVDAALLARVVHNLATTDGEPLARVGINGAGVRDLEAPFSKRRHGDAPAEPPTKPRGKTTAAKKTAATTAASTQEGSN